MNTRILNIRKRSGAFEAFDPTKINAALYKAFASTDELISDPKLLEITQDIVNRLNEECDVEQIQDVAEQVLMENGYFKTAKAYILYRQSHYRLRETLNKIVDLVIDPQIQPVLREIQKDFSEPEYSLERLQIKAAELIREDQSQKIRLSMLERAASELVSRKAPKWEEIAARILNYELEKEISANMVDLNIHSWPEKLEYLTSQNLLLPDLLKKYTKEDLEILNAAMKPERTRLFKHPGLDLLKNRYLIVSHDGKPLESVQEMFMGIAMHLAMPEQNYVEWAIRFYDMLSTLQVTMATPTMANARKPFHQMSSCFIDTVEDSLSGIYKSLDNFARVSKHGGGMGLYLGKVRASGSDIRGFEGAAGGVIRWIRLINDTAIAVDQLGVRSGAAAVYLDIWHRDIPEFMQLRTNNGDERMKAHDIFPALCVPDLFWRLAKTDLDSEWHLMDPHQILRVKGWCLEDSYGDEWERKYFDCVSDPKIEKRTLSVKDMIRMMIKSMVETGTPFIFNRDLVNEANPNSHQGMIYASNLCTEIAQNMSAMHQDEPTIIQCDGETIISTITHPGDFVVCNLASLSLGHIDVNDDDKLKQVITTVMRALDNVIDLNYYPLPTAKLTSQSMRPVGLGTSGYQHLLAKQHIPFENERHLTYMDDLYERIIYHALQASCELAREKGSYAHFKGSDYDTGEYFVKRDYTSEKWKKLASEIHENGLRNGYLMAIAPTSSTSILAGTTAAVDPILKKFYLEEKKGSMLTRVAPDLSDETFWYYKNAHFINQNWVVDAAGIRQRHIDQAQSVNLYITPEFTFRKILDLYIRAWEKGVKTIYYVRSQSLEVEECESCSA
ncbi:ribonucleoside-diphosphate reductase subunit alpha [Ileibacterium valens]|uniref:ribonucleoside-diphosphate reductase subunit alpha n=2 Tax=Ileibacterium valens TaxID=1862668 RepID=UPI003D2FA444